MIHTLDNGLKVAVRQEPGNVTYAGIVIGAGTRDEPADHPGLAHFVEHTIFKGTAKRSACHISNRMEAIGGEINAYTTKEITSVYTIAPRGYDERAVELIADLIDNPTFPEAEIDKEREVIVEEINSYLDNPAENVFDRFENLFYKGSTLANNILGTPESVRAITGKDCLDFVKSRYAPQRMAAFISTPLEPEKALKIARKHWGPLTGPSGELRREPTPALEPFDITEDHGGHQAHTIVGARMFPRTDSRRFALMLLNNYLGGPCMNSRLNRELREKRGLVYAVDSFGSLLSDTGALMIYFGTDPKTVGKCLRIIRNELNRLAENKLTPRALDKIKEQYCGQLLVSSDNKESMAMSMGKNLLFYARLTDIGALAARLREVEAEEIRQVAELLAPNLCSRLTLR